MVPSEPLQWHRSRNQVFSFFPESSLQPVPRTDRWLTQVTCRRLRTSVCANQTRRIGPESRSCKSERYRGQARQAVVCGGYLQGDDRPIWQVPWLPHWFRQNSYPATTEEKASEEARAVWVHLSTEDKRGISANRPKFELKTRAWQDYAQVLRRQFLAD